SGAIGTLAIQIALAMGSRVAGSASARNHDYMRRLGAEVVVDYHDDNWIEQIKSWQSKGVDAALAIPPQTSMAVMDLVKDGGSLVTVSGDKIVPERQIHFKQV